MKTVIFVCDQNDASSQMAAAFFNSLADPARARALSAGIAPAVRLNPVVIAVMREVAIELSESVPKLLTTELTTGAALLVAVGGEQPVPPTPGVPHLVWPVDDATHATLTRVREIRDDIMNRVEVFVEAQGWTATK